MTEIPRWNENEQYECQDLGHGLSLGPNKT